MNGNLLNTLYGVLRAQLAQIAKRLIARILSDALCKTGDLQKYLKMAGIDPNKLKNNVASKVTSFGVSSKGSRKLTAEQKESQEKKKKTKEEKKAELKKKKQEAINKLNDKKDKLKKKAKLALQKTISNITMQISAVVSKMRSLYESYLNDLNSIAIGFANVGTGSFDLVSYFIKVAPSIIGACAVGPTAQTVLIMTQISNLQKKACDLSTEISKVQSLMKKLQLQTIGEAIKNETGETFIITFVDIIDQVLSTAKKLTSICGVFTPEGLTNLAASAVEMACAQAEAALNEAYDKLEKEIMNGSSSGIGSDSSTSDSEINVEGLLSQYGFSDSNEIPEDSEEEKSLVSEAESDQEDSIQDAYNSPIEKDIKPYFCEHFVYNQIEFSKSKSNNYIPTYPYQVDENFYLQKGLTVSQENIDPDTGEVTYTDEIVWEYVYDSDGNKIIPSVKHCAYSYQYLTDEESSSSSDISSRAESSLNELNKLFNELGVETTDVSQFTKREDDPDEIETSEAPDTITVSSDSSLGTKPEASSSGSGGSSSGGGSGSQGGGSSSDSGNKDIDPSSSESFDKFRDSYPNLCTNKNILSISKFEESQENYNLGISCKLNSINFDKLCSYYSLLNKNELYIGYDLFIPNGDSWKRIVSTPVGRNFNSTINPETNIIKCINYVFGLNLSEDSTEDEIKQKLTDNDIFSSEESIYFTTVFYITNSDSFNNDYPSNTCSVISYEKLEFTSDNTIIRTVNYGSNTSISFKESYNFDTKIFEISEKLDKVVYYDSKEDSSFALNTDSIDYYTCIKNSIKINYNVSLNDSIFSVSDVKGKNINNPDYLMMNRVIPSMSYDEIAKKLECEKEDLIFTALLFIYIDEEWKIFTHCAGRGINFDGSDYTKYSSSLGWGSDVQDFIRRITGESVSYSEEDFNNSMFEKDFSYYCAEIGVLSKDYVDLDLLNDLPDNISIILGERFINKKSSNTTIREIYYSDKEFNLSYDYENNTLTETTIDITEEESDDGGNKLFFLSAASTSAKSSSSSDTKTLKLSAISDFKIMKSCSNECKYCIKFKKRDE